MALIIIAIVVAWLGIGVWSARIIDRSYRRKFGSGTEYGFLAVVILIGAFGFFAALAVHGDGFWKKERIKKEKELPLFDKLLGRSHDA